MLLILNNSKVHEKNTNKLYCRYDYNNNNHNVNLHLTNNITNINYLSFYNCFSIKLRDFFFIFNNKIIFKKIILLLKKIVINKKNKKKKKIFFYKNLIKFLPENYFLILVFTRFKNKNLYKIFIKKFGSKIPNIILLSLISLEPNIFLLPLIVILNKSYFTSHRKTLKKMIYYLLAIVWSIDVICGFEFFIVGKIAVGGNARTRTLNTIYGLRARSKLWLLGNKINDIVYTATGCLGISLFLSF